MRSIHFTFLILLAMPLVSVAQVQEPNGDKRFIEVTGSAEREIEPNEIVLFVKLREFEDNRQKMSLEKIDQDFLNALKAAGIDRKKLQLAGGGSMIEKISKRDKEAFREKSYHVNLSSATELERLIEKLEPVPVYQAYIMRLDHTEMEKMKLELKVKALQAAKAKAETMLKSIGAEIGKTLLVREWDYGPPVPMARMDMMTANLSMEAADQGEEAVGFRKIKLREQVTAQFEIR